MVAVVLPGPAVPPAAPGATASRRDPRLNVTDIYAFDSNDATVLTMIVNSSLAWPGRVAGYQLKDRDTATGR
jgi:hypothetical protein